MDDIAELQKLTSSISATMVMASEEFLDADIMRALKKIVAFLDVDRAVCLKFSAIQGLFAFRMSGTESG